MLPYGSFFGEFCIVECCLSIPEPRRHDGGAVLENCGIRMRSAIGLDTERSQRLTNQKQISRYLGESRAPFDSNEGDGAKFNGLQV